MSRALIALGSNLGDSFTIMQQAISEIEQLSETHVEAVSNLYETEPVGGPEQNSFLNAAILISTSLEPQNLLAALHEIEALHGRTREIQWGPRTLDLDLIDYENFTSTDESLKVPHPLASERSFVLAPCADVAPEWKLFAPRHNSAVTIKELLAEMQMDMSEVREVVNEAHDDWWCL
jgi:dihydroneopterin aldolase/2-amino-4-hydroxy-6-hydroxymethyldihydropteridine diphosphokinase